MPKKKQPKTLREKIEALRTYYGCNECDPYGLLGATVELYEVIKIIDEHLDKKTQS